MAVAGTAYAALAASRDEDGAIGARDTRRIVAALAPIDAVDDQDTCIEDLAAQAAMSPWHFLRVWHRVVGMSPRQYQLYRRLQRVALALRTGPSGVTNLAVAAGFNDLSTFARRFKQDLGMTPRAWRAAQPRGQNARP